MKRKFWKILLISSVFACVSVLGSTAYAQEILWIKYDDFESVSKSNNLWELGTSNMCSEHNPYSDSGKMFQEAAVDWYSSSCSTQTGYPNRVRSWARPLVAPYITGLRARVTLNEYIPYVYVDPFGYRYSNNIRGRSGAIFYNDGVLINSGDGTDMTSEVHAGLDIRPTQIVWYVARLMDPLGIVGTPIAVGGLFAASNFPPFSPTSDLKDIPFDLKLWFDGTKIYFSAEVEMPTGEIIKVESTYTPGGEILPPKTPLLGD